MTKRIEHARELVRRHALHLTADRSISRDLEAIAVAIEHGEFDEFTTLGKVMEAS
jgi:hypothetical protein